MCIRDSNTSVRDLLTELDTETFLFDLAHPLDEVPEVSGFEVSQSEPAQLTVAVHRGQRLNDIFESLSAQGIQVVSMRNRANRLEEMFVSMVEQGNEALDRAAEAARSDQGKEARA